MTNIRFNYNLTGINVAMPNYSLGKKPEHGESVRALHDQVLRGMHATAANKTRQQSHSQTDAWKAEINANHLCRVKTLGLAITLFHSVHQHDQRLSGHAVQGRHLFCRH